ncbi:MAG: hypothetical protein AAGA75_21470 [Cyanobacteria bacterium P01_E01_bin.6]
MTNTIFENESIYTAPTDESPRLEYVATAPPTQLETVERRRFPAVWMALAIVGGLTGFLLIWNRLNSSVVFPSEVVVDTNIRAQQSQQATLDQGAATDESIEVTESQPTAIQLGGTRTLPYNLTTTATRLEAQLLDLQVDLECGYFNGYFKQVYEAADNGVLPIIPLRDEANNLLWEMKQLSGIASLEERTDSAQVIREKMTALVAVTSVVTGDRTNETVAFCDYSIGESVNAAQDWVNALSDLVDQRTARLVR